MGISATTNNSYSKINTLINSARYNESFLLLKRELQNYASLKKVLEKLKEVETNYKYLLEYLAEGNSDPSLNEMLEQIRESLLNANDILRRESLLTESSDIYSSTRRLEMLRNVSFNYYLKNYISSLGKDRETGVEQSGNIVTAEQARALDEIFNYVWTINNQSPEEYIDISNALANPDLPEYFKSLVTSAIILGNISYFDANSYEILLNQYENSDSISLRAKAFMGIVLVALLHPDRLAYNIRISSRLLLMADYKERKKFVQEALLAIIKTFDTKRIDNKLRNELIPGLMKIKPEIIDKMKNLSSDAYNFLSYDINPQWEELLGNSEIGDKLREINDMQLEGADVMVTAFSTLKGFPFFDKISNWFLPFTSGHYEFNDISFINNGDSASRFTSVMCDSDLHSFLLSIKSMPEDKRNQMLSNMEMQMKEAHEVLTNSIGETDQQIFSKKLRHSLQDLYRFFKFFKKKNDFSDPFERPFVADDIRPVMQLLGIDWNDIRLVAEFYFKNNYFKEAACLFELLSLQQADIQIWEKIGYCYERLRQWDKTVEWYKKAEIVNSGNEWLEKKLALALKNSGQPTEALEYFEKALCHEPENYHLLMSAGQCYLDIKEIHKALQQFYHAQYLKPDKLLPQRAIAWAELIGGNHDKAISQYQKILSNPNVEKEDFLNAAHAALAMKNFKDSVKLYRQFIELANRDITNLVLAFKEDSESLRQLGIKTSDLRLIVDKIRYDMQE